MGLKVIKAGLQTSLQGKPYSGYRHLGMPATGAADCLSLAMANRLVGNDPDILAIEITVSETVFMAEASFAAALTGATNSFQINGTECDLHQAQMVNPGDMIKVGPAFSGCRSYLALSSRLQAESLLDGESTYIPANLGGYCGRALSDGDILEFSGNQMCPESLRSTPKQFRTVQSDNSLLRAAPGPEYDRLDSVSKECLTANRWTISSRSSRMGSLLEGQKLDTGKDASMPSAPVFPGTIQCPPDGSPFLLGPDAQTTGGYPRIAQIIRADRHLIGQLKPGSKVQLVMISPDRATEIYREKLALLKPWLGSINLW